MAGNLKVFGQRERLEAREKVICCNGFWNLERERVLLLVVERVSHTLLQ